MASSAEKKFLEMKLGFLEKKEQRLCSLIQEKCGKVVTNARACLSDSSQEESGCSYIELDQQVENTVKFVRQMLKEFEGLRYEETASDSSAKQSGTSNDSPSSSVDKKEIKSLKSRMKKMEEAIKTLTTQQTSLGDDMANLSARQSTTEDTWMEQFNQVTDKMTDLSQHADEYVQQNNRKIQSLEEELHTLRKSQEDLNKDMADKTDRNEALQRTLDTLQEEMGTVQVDIQNLRDAIHEQGEDIQESKDDTMKMKKITELSSLISEAQSPESKCARQVVGFSAGAVPGYRPTEDEIVKWDKDDVNCNTDKSFNVDTGIFTAPVSGVYFVGLWLWQCGDGDMGLDVCKTSKSTNPSGQSERQKLFLTYTDKDRSSDTGIVVTELKKGETVSVEVFSANGDVDLNNATNLTVFLIT